MADYLVTDQELTNIADTIRNNLGTEAALIFPSGFLSGIDNIRADWVDVRDSTVTAATLVDGVVAYNAAGQRIVGNLSNIVNVTNFSGTVSLISGTTEDYLLTITS